MAAANLRAELLEEATCPICRELFTDPVTLDCGHSFCDSCFTRFKASEDLEKFCPECRQPFDPKKELKLNRRLANMAEVLKRMQIAPGSLCEEHGKRLQLFCETHGELLCVDCRESQDHREHRVRSIEEAELEYKVKLQDWLRPLRNEMGYTLEYKLKEEEQYHTLRDFRSTLTRCEEVKFEGPEKIKKYKVMVTLDPDTAYPGLLLSEGRRHVRWTGTAQPPPPTTKRFTYRYPCVLGSEGFTSGRHYWEVQLLREGVQWDVGVAAESVDRKGRFTWSPEGGVWAVQRWWGQYKALTSPVTPLSPREKPLKLGVYLDYEGGRLSLYNADSWELLYSFPRAPFTQRLFPLFNLWGGTELKLV